MDIMTTVVGFNHLSSHVQTEALSSTPERGSLQKKYARFNASYQYLGNDFDENYLKEQGITHNVIAERTEIAAGVWALTHFKRTHREETIHPRFVLREQDSWWKTDLMMRCCW